MRHRAAFRLACVDAQVARSAAQALLPELNDGPPSTQASVRVDGAELVVALAAEDLSGLRALQQGLVRLADTAIRVAEGRE